MGIIAKEASTKLVQSNENKGPNIILILTDDLSVNMINFLRENKMMPNLQEFIIDEGTTFTNSFVSSPLCCPSRATLLTGQYPHNHGVEFNSDVEMNGELIAKGGMNALNDSSTIATWLSESGYSTGFMGKYLNGYAFPRNYQYIPPGWDYWFGFNVDVQHMYNFSVNENGNTVRYTEEYKTNYLARKTVDFIKDSEKPFFLLISTVLPHSDGNLPKCKLMENRNNVFYTVEPAPQYIGTLNHLPIPKSPSFNEVDVSDKHPEQREASKIVSCIDSVFRDRTSSIMSIDDLIGKVYVSLEINDEIDNTVIIFTSDNGFLFGEHRLIGKLIPYEESIRVPLFLRAPNFSTQSIDSLVVNNDLTPTISDLAGIEAEIPMDGSSLVPLLEDPSTKIREGFLIESFTIKKNFYHAIRGNNFLYVEYGGAYNYTEFYDLKSDPFQESNLANCINDQCEIIEPYHTWLEELKKCGMGTCQDLENKQISYQ